MKRYITSSSAVENADQWFDKVKRTIDQSNLSSIIGTYKEDNTLAGYPCIDIKLKDPYVVRYYPRVGASLPYITIAPNQRDYISPGSPDLLFTLPDNISDNAAIKKFNKLYDKIINVTNQSR